MNQAFDPLNLLLLAIAVVVFFKLRSVLGARTGHEKPLDFPPAAPETDGEGKADKVIPPPGARETPALGLPEERAPVWEGVAEEGSPLAKTLEDMVERDPDFSVKGFLDGAGTAYEMIVTAFADGDKKTLKPLLSKEVYQGFAQAIDERKARGETLELRFVGLDEAKIVDGAVHGRKGRLTVKFVSEVLTALRDGKGEVLEGDPRRITQVTDIWTFERDLGSRDPNWKLVATEAQD